LEIEHHQLSLFKNELRKILDTGGLGPQIRNDRVALSSKVVTHHEEDGSLARAFTTGNDPNFASGGLEELGRLDEVILKRPKLILRGFRAKRQALQCRLAAASWRRLDRLRGNKGLSAELQDPFSDLRLAPNPYNVVSIIERGRSCPKARYSITLSARSTRPAGISCPIALAVLRLITNSNVVGCSTGRSAGFAPLSILATIRAR
jgi:hypothetical protein